MPPRDDLHLRIGDAERNAVADALARHFADGRIDEAELKERLDGVMGAKTGEDLDGFLDDLPHLEGDPHVHGAASAPGFPAPEPSGPHPGHRPSHLSKVCLLVAGVLAIFTWGHAFWWTSWFPFPPLGWLVVGVIALALYRRRRFFVRVRSEPRRCTCRTPRH